MVNSINAVRSSYALMGGDLMQVDTFAAADLFHAGVSLAVN
jgi:hypothetical protein